MAKSRPFCNIARVTARPLPRHRPDTPSCFSTAEVALEVCVFLLICSRSRTRSTGAVIVLEAAPATEPIKADVINEVGVGAEAMSSCRADEVDGAAAMASARGRQKASRKFAFAASRASAGGGASLLAAARRLARGRRRGNPLPMERSKASNRAPPLSRTEEALIRFVNLPFALAMPVLLAAIASIGWLLSKYGLHSTSL